MHAGGRGDRRPPRRVPADKRGLMADTQCRCQTCGQPAHIHVTSEWTGATGVRHLCFDCAELERTVRYRRKAAFNLGAVLMVVGGLSLVLSLFADQLAFGHSQGFGFWQIVGLATGFILSGVGAIMRIPTVLAIGPCVALLSLLADQLRLGEGPGFGRKQMAGCAAGGVLILLGLLIVALRKRWAARLQPASGAHKTA
jgi:hypothetical protein